MKLYVFPKKRIIRKNIASKSDFDKMIELLKSNYKFIGRSEGFIFASVFNALIYLLLNHLLK